MKSTKRNIDYLREQILPILLPYGVKRVTLFGSTVHGMETPESDIDILVRFTKPIGLLRWVKL
ncbi:MAG: nucleotidyltransferase domain-containing protein, partial [Anaerolineae bacterium]|nr:nucleotidyltransferase domain-containing protein [Anaerolineae bacterium]